MQKLVGRSKAVQTVLGQKMLEAFKADFYDQDKECYKTKGIGEFIQNIQTIRLATQDDDDLAASMGNVRLG